MRLAEPPLPPSPQTEEESGLFCSHLQAAKPGESPLGWGTASCFLSLPGWMLSGVAKPGGV